MGKLKTLGTPSPGNPNKTSLGGNAFDKIPVKVKSTGQNKSIGGPKKFKGQVRADGLKKKKTVFQ